LLKNIFSIHSPSFQTWYSYALCALILAFSALHPVSSIQHQASSTLHPAPGIQYPVSGIRYPVSGTPHPLSGIRHPAPRNQNLKLGGWKARKLEGLKE